MESSERYRYINWLERENEAYRAEIKIRDDKVEWLLSELARMTMQRNAEREQNKQLIVERKALEGVLALRKEDG